MVPPQDGESPASVLHRGLMARDIRGQGLALFWRQYLRNIARQSCDPLRGLVHCLEVCEAQGLNCAAVKRVGGEQLQELRVGIAHLFVHRAKIEEQRLQQRVDLRLLRGCDLDIGKQLFDVGLRVHTADWAV